MIYRQTVLKSTCRTYEQDRPLEDSATIIPQKVPKNNNYVNQNRYGNGNPAQFTQHVQSRVYSNKDIERSKSPYNVK